MNNQFPHRDQNFGLNELAAVQDVRNEFNLQDIDGGSGTGTSSTGTSSDLLQTSNLFKEKGKMIDWWLETSFETVFFISKLSVIDIKEGFIDLACQTLVDSLWEGKQRCLVHYIH